MHKTMLVGAAALGLLSLGACAMPTKPMPGPERDQCGASKLGRYLGKHPSDRTLAAIRALAKPAQVRITRPGQPVTMDYRPDRLNIDIGENGRIKRFHCV